MDANDIDQNQLGKCDDFPLTDDQIQDAMKDNPSGQGGELTPLILIRPLAETTAGGAFAADIAAALCRGGKDGSGADIAHAGAASGQSWLRRRLFDPLREHNRAD